MNQIKREVEKHVIPSQQYHFYDLFSNESNLC